MMVFASVALLFALDLAALMEVDGPRQWRGDRVSVRITGYSRGVQMGEEADQREAKLDAVKQLLVIGEYGQKDRESLSLDIWGTGAEDVILNKLFPDGAPEWIYEGYGPDGRYKMGIEGDLQLAMRVFYIEEPPFGFTICAVSSHLVWDYGTTKLDKDFEFDDVVSSEGIRQAVSESTYLICIGTSSQEGKQTSQEKLSLDRTVALMDVAKIAWPEKAEEGVIYGWNVGQHKEITELKSGSETRYQRRVLIVAAVGVGSTEELKASLIDSLTRSDLLEMLDLSAYSKFEDMTLIPLK